MVWQNLTEDISDLFGECDDVSRNHMLDQLEWRRSARIERDRQAYHERRNNPAYKATRKAYWKVYYQKLLADPVRLAFYQAYQRSWRQKKKDCPEWLEASRTKAKAYAEKNREKFKAYHRVYQRDYAAKKKDCPEWLAKRRAYQRAYYAEHKTEPVKKKEAVKACPEKLEARRAYYRAYYAKTKTDLAKVEARKAKEKKRLDAIKADPEKLAAKRAYDRALYQVYKKDPAKVEARKAYTQKQKEAVRADPEKLEAKRAYARAVQKQKRVKRQQAKAEALASGSSERVGVACNLLRTKNDS